MEFFDFLIRYVEYFGPGLIAFGLIGAVWWRRYALDALIGLAALVLMAFFVTYNTGELADFWPRWVAPQLMAVAFTSSIRQGNIIITARVNRGKEESHVRPVQSSD